MTTERERPPCDAEMIGRDGKPMGYRCNLPSGHLGGCAMTYEFVCTYDEPTTTAKDADEK
jgi:hypothetical protein